MLVGNLNIDLQRDNALSRRMCSIAERQGIIFCWNHVNVDFDYTYANVGAGHYSSLDHFIVPPVLYECIDIVVCSDTRLNPSLYMTLNVVFNGNIERIRVSEKVVEKRSIAWHIITEQGRIRFKESAFLKLKHVNVPSDAIMCSNVNCDDYSHRQQLSEYCHDLIQACIKTVDECFPKVKSKKTQILYCNEVVQHLKDYTLFWSSIWISCVKLREGDVDQIMRHIKHR